MTPSMEDYFLRRPVPTTRKVFYWLNFLLHVYYTIILAVLMNNDHDDIVRATGMMFKSVVSVKLMAGAMFYCALIMITLVGHYSFLRVWSSGAPLGRHMAYRAYKSISA